LLRLGLILTKRLPILRDILQSILVPAGTAVIVKLYRSFLRMLKCS
jgi:hypothetical protein